MDDTANPAVEPASTPVETGPKDIREEAHAFLEEMKAAEAPHVEPAEAGGEAPFTGDEGTEQADEAEEKVLEDEDEDEGEEELSKSQKKKRESVKRLKRKLEEKEMQYAKEAQEAEELMYRALEEIEALRAREEQYQSMLQEYQLDSPVTEEQLQIQQLQRELAARERQQEYAKQMQIKSQQAAFMKELEDAASSANISVQELAHRLQARGYTKPENQKLLTVDVLRQEAAEFARYSGRAKTVQDHVQTRAKAPRAISPKAGVSGGTAHSPQPGERDYRAAAARYLTDLHGGRN